jgi:CHAT domain-containing protein/tetratricopeptide (TPR) repeat protein
MRPHHVRHSIGVAGVVCVATLPPHVAMAQVPVRPCRAIDSRPECNRVPTTGASLSGAQRAYLDHATSLANIARVLDRAWVNSSVEQRFDIAEVWRRAAIYYDSAGRRLEATRALSSAAYDFRRAGRTDDSTRAWLASALGWQRDHAAHNDAATTLFYLASTTANVDSSRAFAREGIAEAQRTGTVGWEYSLLEVIRASYATAAKRDSALFFAREIATLAERHDSPSWLASAIENMATAYLVMAPVLPDSALALSRRSVSVRLRSRQLAAARARMNSVANAYTQKGELTRALEVLRAAVTFGDSVRDSVPDRERLSVYTLYQAMAGVFDRADQLDSTRHYQRLAEQTARRYDAAVRAEGRPSSAAASVLMSIGTIYTRLGELDSARIALHAALSTLGDPGADRLMSSSILSALRESWVNENSDSAQSYARRAVDLFSEPSNFDRTARAQAQLSLATIMGRAHQIDSAGVLRDSATAQLAAVAKTDAVASATSVNPINAAYAQISLAGSLRDAGQIDGARAWLDSATTRLAGVARTPNPVWGSLMIERARLYARLGRPDSAAWAYRQAFDHFQRFDLPDWAATTLNYLGGIQLFTSHPDSALATQRHALEIFRQIGNRSGVYSSNGSMASAFDAMGYSDSAIAYRRVAQAGWDRINRPVEAAGQLSEIAWDYHFGDYPDSAFVFLRQVMDVANARRNRGLRLRVLSYTASVFSVLGRHDSALAYARAYVDSVSRGARSAAVMRIPLHNLGSYEAEAGLLDSARAHLLRSIALSDSVADVVAAARTRVWLTQAHNRAGHPDSALTTARSALLVLRQALNQRYEGQLLSLMGSAFAQQGRSDSALAYYTEALSTLRGIHDNPGIRQTLAALADLFRTAPPPTRDLNRASAYYDSASAVVADVRRGLDDDASSVAFAEEQRDVYSGWVRNWIALASDVGSSTSARAALGATERGRAQALLDLQRRANPGSTPVIVSRPRIGADLAAEADSLLAPLRVRGATALSYALSDDTLFTWLLRADGALTLLPPRRVSGTTVSSLVAVVRDGLDVDGSRSAALDPDEFATEDPGTSARPRTGPASRRSAARRASADSALRELARLLLPSVLTTAIAPGAEMVVVPSGGLGTVPFAALPMATRTGATQALGLSYAVRYAPSFAALRAAESRPSSLASAPGVGRASRATARALVVGNPTMPMVYSGRWGTRSKMSDLPGAAAEGRAVALRLGAEFLTGGAATETVVRARLSDAPIIHLATHGLAYGSEAKARRSFVALAADSANDGYLTVAELLDGSIRPLRADLVVLSACETGLGSTTVSEGTVGLQRAFLARGARSLLVSLWNVDDAATRLLIERFYMHWLGAEGVSPVISEPEALRRAQADVAKDPRYQSPRYWAAFQLVGAG